MEWQQIKNAPKDGGDILLWSWALAGAALRIGAVYQPRFAAWDTDVGEWMDEQGARVRYATHFMVVTPPKA